MALFDSAVYYWLFVIFLVFVTIYLIYVLSTYGKVESTSSTTTVKWLGGFILLILIVFTILTIIAAGTLTSRKKLYADLEKIAGLPAGSIEAGKIPSTTVMHTQPALLGAPPPATIPFR